MPHRLTLMTALAAALAVTGCAELLSELERELGVDTSTPADGVREALRVGTGRAVGALGIEDGFLGNPEVAIAVPDKFRRIEQALELIGREQVVDEFRVSMNRAAEAAVPVARDVFLDAIRQMTIEDALTIVRGERHEATDYFRRTAGARLGELFRPIVDDKLDSVGATRAFGRVMDQVEQLPLVDRPPFDLTDYVTESALDGLFSTLAKEELRIREDPLARTTELLKRWFG